MGCYYQGMILTYIGMGMSNNILAPPLVDLFDRNIPPDADGLPFLLYTHLFLQFNITVDVVGYDIVLLSFFDKCI